MSRTFRRHGRAIRATLSPDEYELLRALRDQLQAALQAPDPDDPVIQRLFPPPVLGDPEAAREVRELLLDDLLADRLAGLEALVSLLERGVTTRGAVRIDLVEEEPLLVLGVLNDVRLAIGARIDIDVIDRDQVAEDDPIAYRLAVMDHLGWWQEQLLAIIDPSSTHHAGAGAWRDDEDDDVPRPEWPDRGTS